MAEETDEKSTSTRRVEVDKDLLADIIAHSKKGKSQTGGENSEEVMSVYVSWGFKVDKLLAKENITFDQLLARLRV